MAHPRAGSGLIRKQFFSEEKNQKTFIFDAIPDLSAAASIFPQALEQWSFGSFLQKRTAFSIQDEAPNKRGKIRSGPDGGQPSKRGFALQHFPNLSR
jgi:hypothetical protein